MMFGYACDETPELMPMTISLAHKLAKQLAKVRKDGTLSYLRPDGKTQVTAEYEGDTVKRIDAIVISTQHSESVSLEQIRRDMIEYVVKPIVPAELIDENTKYYVNPTGRFVIGARRLRPHGPRGARRALGAHRQGGSAEGCAVSDRTENTLRAYNGAEGIFAFRPGAAAVFSDSRPDSPEGWVIELEPIVIVLICMLACCVAVAAAKAVSLWLTRSRLLREEAPFTVYVTAQTADQAEYVVRSALERVKWLDLYGMCRIICLNPSGDPEIETIYRNLLRKYPFAEIGALQTRKDVL